MAEPLNTGLSAQQVLTAFDRALNDYTDAEIDALLGAKQDTISDLATIRSGAAAGATAVQPASLSAETSAREAADSKMQAAIGTVANAGAKNILKITGSSQTINGVTFTVNDDQTVTVNGTASATISYVITDNAQAVLIPDGNYILSGCPQGGGTSSYDLRWYMYSSGKSAYDMGSGATVTKDGNTTSSNIAIVIRSGATANNLVFKPMLSPPEIAGDFQPYAPTNRELYEMILALQNGV